MRRLSVNEEPPLDFAAIRGMEKRRYISAIHASVDEDYEPMVGIFEKLISRTLRTASGANDE